MHEYFKKYQDELLKSQEVMCPDFCIARVVQVCNIMWVPPHDFCSTPLQGLYLICIQLPLADEFQEPVEPRKQPLANQSVDLKVPCLLVCLYCSFRIFYVVLVYQWFPILCSQNWIFKVFIFVIYCGNSGWDFASSVMTLVSHGVGLNSNQPNFGQLCTIYFRVKMEKKIKKK